MIRNRFLLVILFLISGTTSVSAQDIHTKLLEQAELSESDLRSLVAFDSIPFLLMDHAHVDTTAIVSEDLLCAVIVLSNETQTASEFYLMTFDRIKSRVIDLLFLSLDSDIDQTPGNQFKRSEHDLRSNGEIQLSDFDCSLIKQEYGDLLAECVEIDQRHYFIDPQGLIQER